MKRIKRKEVSVFVCSEKEFRDILNRWEPIWLYRGVINITIDFESWKLVFKVPYDELYNFGFWCGRVRERSLVL